MSWSASTTGTDVEYVEIFGEPNTNYSALTILEIEGDSGTTLGVIDEVIASWYNGYQWFLSGGFGSQHTGKWHHNSFVG